MQLGLTSNMASSTILVPLTHPAVTGCGVIIRPLGESATPEDPELLGRLEAGTEDGEPFPQTLPVAILAGLLGTQAASVRTCPPGKQVWQATAGDIQRYESAYGRGVVESWALVTV